MHEQAMGQQYMRVYHKPQLTLSGCASCHASWCCAREYKRILAFKASISYMLGP